MRWDNVWIFPFYLADFVVLAAALFCLAYFLRYRSSPLVQASHSNVDNGILISLCLFSLLPVVYFGEMSRSKCVCLWLVQNVMFSIYCGLLFTKMPFLKNTQECRKIACEQALDLEHIDKQQSPTLRARQEIVYPALFVMLPVIVTMVTVPFSDGPEVKHFACPSLEFAGLCAIHGNISVFASMAYTWSLLLSLSVLALAENNGTHKSWKIPWVILCGFLSYTALICSSYLKIQCTNYSWFNFAVYLLIVINPVVCLTTLYLPKLHFITTCSLHLKSFRKSSRSMRKCSVHFDRQSSTGEVIVNYSLHAGPHAGFHESTVQHASTRPASYISDISSRIFNIQKSIHIVSNLFRVQDPGNKLLRPISCYDNVPHPVPTWDNISQSSHAISLASYEDGRSEDSFEAEISLEELKEMTEFLKGLRSSDV